MVDEAVIQPDAHRRKMNFRKHSGPTMIVVLPLAIGFRSSIPQRTMRSSPAFSMTRRSPFETTSVGRPRCRRIRCTADLLANHHGRA
jgi:hypothetical protein